MTIDWSDPNWRKRIDAKVIASRKENRRLPRMKGYFGAEMQNLCQQDENGLY